MPENNKTNAEALKASLRSRRYTQLEDWTQATFDRESPTPKPPVKGSFIYWATRHDPSQPG